MRLLFLALLVQLTLSIRAGCSDCNDCCFYEDLGEVGLIAFCNCATDETCRPDGTCEAPAPTHQPTAKPTPRPPTPLPTMRPTSNPTGNPTEGPTSTTATAATTFLATPTFRASSSTTSTLSIVPSAAPTPTPTAQVYTGAANSGTASKADRESQPTFVGTHGTTVAIGGAAALLVCLAVCCLARRARSGRTGHGVAVNLPTLSLPGAAHDTSATFPSVPRARGNSQRHHQPPPPQQLYAQQAPAAGYPEPSSTYAPAGAVQAGYANQVPPATYAPAGAAAPSSYTATANHYSPAGVAEAGGTYGQLHLSSTTLASNVTIYTAPTAGSDPVLYQAASSYGNTAVSPARGRRSRSHSRSSANNTIISQAYGPAL